MNFKSKPAVKYIMVKIKTAICFILCLAVLGLSLVFGFSTEKNENIDDNTVVLSLWQVDGFEGGKGSRASYIQSAAKKLADENIFLNVITISSEAVRQNLSNGVSPDLISFAAGAYGLEHYIYENYYCWCNGSYCIFTLDLNADFEDINQNNVVINSGKDNLAQVAALFLGLENAQYCEPTNAYVELINGKYKYMLGTQRDIYRFKTRGVAFKLKAVDEFNDLYQNIAITLAGEKKYAYCSKFITALLDSSDSLKEIGMLGGENYYDELNQIKDTTYKYTLKSPITEDVYKQILKAANEKNLNNIKLYLNN